MARSKGTVAKWLNHKGIGFITPAGEEADTGKDLLVHFSEIKQETDDGFKSLNMGAEVEYDVKEDPKNPEKQVAVNVTGLDGEDCEARVKGKGKGKGKGRKGKGKGKGDDEE